MTRQRRHPAAIVIAGGEIEAFVAQAEAFLIALEQKSYAASPLIVEPGGKQNNHIPRVYAYDGEGQS